MGRGLGLARCVTAVLLAAWPAGAADDQTTAAAQKLTQGLRELQSAAELYVQSRLAAGLGEPSADFVQGKTELDAEGQKALAASQTQLSAEERERINVAASRLSSGVGCIRRLQDIVASAERDQKAFAELKDKPQYTQYLAMVREALLHGEKRISDQSHLLWPNDTEDQGLVLARANCTARLKCMRFEIEMAERTKHLPPQDPNLAACRAFLGEQVKQLDALAERSGGMTQPGIRSDLAAINALNQALALYAQLLSYIDRAAEWRQRNEPSIAAPARAACGQLLQVTAAAWQTLIKATLSANPLDGDGGQAHMQALREKGKLEKTLQWLKQSHQRLQDIVEKIGQVQQRVDELLAANPLLARTAFVARFQTAMSQSHQELGKTAAEIFGDVTLERRVLLESQGRWEMAQIQLELLLLEAEQETPALTFLAQMGASKKNPAVAERITNYEAKLAELRRKREEYRKFSLLLTEVTNRVQLLERKLELTMRIVNRRENEMKILTDELAKLTDTIRAVAKTSAQEAEGKDEQEANKIAFPEPVDNAEAF